jgi:hypothetical protein
MAASASSFSAPVHGVLEDADRDGHAADLIGTGGKRNLGVGLALGEQAHGAREPADRAGDAEEGKSHRSGRGQHAETKDMKVMAMSATLSLTASILLTAK